MAILLIGLMYFWPNVKSLRSNHAVLTCGTLVASATNVRMHYYHVKIV